MVFRSAKFCAHCGANLLHSAAEGAALPCPKCKEASLAQVKLGRTPVHECGKCHGLWVENAVFEQICADRERQSAALGRASANFRPGGQRFETSVRYVPCPVCSHLMHRMNFAKCSGIVVDACRTHGTWFDRDELQHIVEFIRAGGMDLAREKEKAELEATRRTLELARRNLTANEDFGRRRTFDETDLFEIAGSILRALD